MRRRVTGLDRVLVLLLGLVLLVGGAAAITWTAGWLRQLLPGAPASVSAAPVGAFVGQSSYPWVSLGAGVVLGLLALWWLLAHRTHTGVGDLRLPGSGTGGALLLAPSAAVDAAADVVAEEPGVRRASGRVGRERGHLLAELSVQVDPGADLQGVSDACSAALAQLGGVVGRPDLRARVRLSVARSARPVGRAQ